MKPRIESLLRPLAWLGAVACATAAASVLIVLLSR
jgi:hypothetical protein